MKAVGSIVLLFVGFFVAIDFMSKSTMGKIESGLPGGGHGKFADYHENPIEPYLKSISDWYYSTDSESGVGAVSVNPYSEVE